VNSTAAANCKHIFANDIELNAASIQVAKSYSLSFSEKSYLSHLLSKFTREKKGVNLSGYRSNIQQNLADEMRCCKSLIKKIEKRLVEIGILTKEPFRGKDRFKKRRRLRLGSLFFLALKLARKAKKPNDKRRATPCTSGGVRGDPELISDKVNIDSKIGNMPKERDMPPIRKGDSNPNPSKTILNSLLEKTGLRNNEKKSSSKACDITDEIFPKSGDGFIPWEELNPSIERLIVLRGHKAVRRDLKALLGGYTVSQRLEYSKKAFSILEEQYRS